MKFWRVSVGLLALSTLIVAGLFLPVTAQDKDKTYEFSFKDSFGGKDPFYQMLKTTTVQKMSVRDKPGQPAMEQKQEQTFIISWTPQKRDGDKGDYILEQKIEFVKMSIKIGTTTIPYDSSKTADQPKNPMTEFFDSLMKVKLKVYIKEDTLKITKIEGRDDFVKKLSENHPQMQNLLKSILSDKAIENMSYQTWAGIPVEKKDALKIKGDPRKVETKLELGAIGTYNNVYTYTLDSVDKDEAKFTVVPKMTYSPPAKVEKTDALPFEIRDKTKLESKDGKDADNKDFTSGGTVVFDIKKGRIKSSSMKMRIEGDVVIDIGGMETTVQLLQTQISELTTGDDLKALTAEATKK